MLVCSFPELKLVVTKVLQIKKTNDAKKKEKNYECKKKKNCYKCPLQMGNAVKLQWRL